MPASAIRSVYRMESGADRLDPEPVPMGVDVRHHRGYLLRRSSAAWAKIRGRRLENLVGPLQLAFSRPSATSRSRSLVVSPGRWPVSRSAWRTHFRRVSAVVPSLVATSCSAAHSDGCAGRCSITSRMARSRTSKVTSARPGRGLQAPQGSGSRLRGQKAPGSPSRRQSQDAL
jgi:hypothetical protein